MISEYLSIYENLCLIRCFIGDLSMICTVRIPIIALLFPPIVVLLKIIL